MQISNAKLIQTGFEFRPIESTLDACMQWYIDHGGQNIKFGGSGIGTGFDRSREVALIQMLKE